MHSMELSHKRTWSFGVGSTHARDEVSREAQISTAMMAISYCAQSGRIDKTPHIFQETQPNMTCAEYLYAATYKNLAQEPTECLRLKLPKPVEKNLDCDNRETRSLCDMILKL